MDLLGQGNRFGFTEVEKLPEFLWHLLTHHRADAEPTRGRSARERGRARPAGPDCELSQLILQGQRSTRPLGEGQVRRRVGGVHARDRQPPKLKRPPATNARGRPG